MECLHIVQCRRRRLAGQWTYSALIKRANSTHCHGGTRGLKVATEIEDGRLRYLKKFWHKWKSPEVKPKKLREIVSDGESPSPDIPKETGRTKCKSTPVYTGPRTYEHICP